MKHIVELGDEAADTVTGFSGVVTAITKYLHGCRRIMLQPRELDSGKLRDAYTFDEPQLRLVSKAFVPSTDATGGVGDTLSKPAGPERR
jgi:hypothetical protein